jgi:hypothetical protein
MSSKIKDNCAGTPNEDVPKNTAVSLVAHWTPKQQVEFIQTNLDNEQENKQNTLAFRIFIILGAFLVLSLAASYLLHILSYEPLRTLENAIVFAQGSVTTVLGFLFGTRMYRKK